MKFAADLKGVAGRLFFISRMFHITGIFPLCILLTTAAEKIQMSFQKSRASRHVSSSDRMSESGTFNNRPIHVAPAVVMRDAVHGKCSSNLRKKHTALGCRAVVQPSDCWLLDN